MARKLIPNRVEVNTQWHHCDDSKEHATYHNGVNKTWQSTSNAFEALPLTLIEIHFDKYVVTLKKNWIICFCRFILDSLNDNNQALHP